MSRITIKDGSFMFREKALAPSSAVVAYWQEAPREEGVLHCQTPYRIDYLMAVGERVVGIESKRPQDLVSSYRARRLARQMRILMRAVDIPCLMLRENAWPKDEWVEDTPMELYRDLVRLQMLGVVLLPGPSLDKDILPWLNGYRLVLEGTRNVMYAVAGTDRPRPKSLLRAIRGVGAKLEERLLARYGSVRLALLAPDNEWALCGARSNVLRSRQEALNGE